MRGFSSPVIEWKQAASIIRKLRFRNCKAKMSPFETATLYVWFKPLVISFLGVLSASVIFFHEWDYAQEKLKVSTSTAFEDTFDFIVGMREYL